MFKILMLIVSVVVAATVSNAQKELKCEPSERQMKIVTDCFKQVTNKELKGEDDFKGLDESTEERITMCAFKKEGIIDDQGFNAGKAEESIRDLKATQETKNKLLENLKKCESEHEKTKVEAILECLQEGDTICEGNMEK